MNARLSPMLSAIALLAAVPASAAVSDFRLPPGNPTPTPRAQGPVDPEDPATRPAPVPTPTPTAAPTPTPVPTVTPTPRLTLPAATPTARTPAPRPTATASRPAPAPTESPALQAEAGASEATPALPSGLPSVAVPAPQAEPAATPADSDDDGLPWGWIALGLAAIAAAGAGWHFRRRLRPQRGSVLMVPEIEKPRVPSAPPAAPPEPEELQEQAPAAAVAEEPTHPLLIAITPIKLTQTFMNEALSYRLTLTNVGPAPLGPVTIAADLAGAHASLSREEQLAGPGTQLPEHKTLAGIAPGEKIEVTGDIRTPLADLPVIRQGSAALLVPLARFRIGAPGMETRHFTLAVGQQQPGASGLLPIRLDLGPRTTDGLAGRAF